MAHYIGTPSADDYFGTPNADTFDMTQGDNDTVHAGGGNDRVNGGGGNDSFYGEDGDDTLKGRSGNDHLIGGAGADVVSGFGGDDYITVHDTLDIVKGNTGTDRIYLDFAAFDAAITLDLTALWSGGMGTMSSALGSGTIEGVEQLEYTSLNGSNYDDTLALGNVTTLNVHGLAGNDTMTGGNSRDVFSGDDGDDTLNGGGGDDDLYGDAGANLLNGGDGNDLIVVESTSDIADGGANVDRLSLDFINFGAGVTVNLTRLWLGGKGTMSSALGSGTIAQVDDLDYLSGSQYDDVLKPGNIATSQINGWGGDDLIKGGNGSDEFRGYDGDDKLNGGDGNDYLYGDAGFDIVKGGDGDDFLRVRDTLDTLDGGAGNDRLQLDFRGFEAGVTMNLAPLWLGDKGIFSSTAGSGAVVNVEQLDYSSYGSDNADSLTMGDIATGAVHGEGGNDTIVGGSAGDGFFGDNGNDTLYGGDGNDSLHGMAGADQITGGLGADVFAYSAIGEATGILYDTVIGFDTAADHFDLPFSVTGIDTTVTGGSLSAATFNADLAAAVGSAQLASRHAVLFTPDTGTLSGQTFLIVEARHEPGYQAGEDIVIRLDGPLNAAGLSTEDFI